MTVFRRENSWVLVLFALWVLCLALLGAWVFGSEPISTFQWVLLIIVGIPAFVACEYAGHYVFGSAFNERSGSIWASLGRITLSVGVILMAVLLVWVGSK